MSSSPVTTLLRDLVAIPTWRGQRVRDALLAVQSWLAGQGIDATLHEFGDDCALVSTWNPSGGRGDPPVSHRNLILHAHMDTVPPSDSDAWSAPPLELTERDGRLYGLGAVDVKGCAAAMAVAFTRLVGEWTGPDSLQLVLVSGEEQGGEGTRGLIRHHGMRGAAIIGEPTNLIPCVAVKGVLRLRIFAHGKAAHASQPYAGVNAVNAICDLALEIERYHERIMERSSPLLGHPSAATTTIQGGIALNIIPDLAALDIDRRLVPPETVDAVQAEVDDMVQRVAARRPGVRFETERVRVLEPVLTSPDDDLVKAAVAASGAEPAGFTACCDLCVAAHEGDVTGIVLGPGSIDQAHQVDEFVPARELEASVDLFVAIANRWRARH